jgi:hypothetical protein
MKSRILYCVNNSSASWVRGSHFLWRLKNSTFELIQQILSVTLVVPTLPRAVQYSSHISLGCPRRLARRYRGVRGDSSTLQNDYDRQRILAPEAKVSVNARNDASRSKSLFLILEGI